MEMLGLSLCMLAHPVNTLRIVQRTREKFAYLPVLLLLGLTVLVRLLFIQWVSYPLQATDPRYANWILESALLLVPLVSLAVCGFATTSILDGEMMMRESLAAVAFSMTPYLLLTLPLAALSHLLGHGSALFLIVQVCIWVWCGVLYIVSLKVMNSYTFAKTLLVLLLTILLMALLWAMVLLAYALWQQLADFIGSVWQEVKFVLRS